MKTKSIGLTHIVLILVGIFLILVCATVVLKGLANQDMIMDEFPINYLATKNWVSDNRSPYDIGEW